MSQFSNLLGGLVSAPVKWGHKWFYQRLNTAVGGWGLTNELPWATTHAHTHSLIHTLLAACLHRVRSCAKQIVTQTWSGEWKRQIWRVSSDCTVIQIQAGIIIICQLLQQTEIDCGGYKQKKKCEFSSCRHWREKTNILSRATFRNFAKQGRWELHCPCQLSSAGKSCWMQEASLAGSIGSTTRRTSVTTQGNSRPRGPHISLCSCTKSLWEDPLCDSHCGWETKKGLSVQLCLSDSVTGDRATPWWFWNERRASKELSAKGGGRIISPAWSGTREATPNFTLKG